MLTTTDSEALVQLALENLSITQRELAVRLGVSPTQISKWKKGEHMSFEMEDKFRLLVGIGDMSPTFVLWSGSLNAAIKWENLIKLLAEEADEGAETGYDTSPLIDQLDWICFETFHVLGKMGVSFPITFPKELENLNLDSEDDSFDPYDLIDRNPYSSLIYKILKSYTNVYGFFAAYISDIVYDDQLVEFYDICSNIEDCLLELAASKLEVSDSQNIAPKFVEFRYKVRKEYEKWLNILKEKAFSFGIPLKEELMKLVYESDVELGMAAEAESLGFNSSRLHPDIYMNELLQGMRAIHQVLPAILKKLGIEDFELDESELRNN